MSGSETSCRPVFPGDLHDTTRPDYKQQCLVGRPGTNVVERETMCITTVPNRTGEQETTMTDTQLLIIGNGFDLQCGLKSTFADFEQDRFAAINEMENRLARGKEPPDITTVLPDGKIVTGNSEGLWFWNEGLSLWDLILRDDRRTRTWYDIEACIKSWVVDRVQPNGTIKPANEEPDTVNETNHKPVAFWDTDIAGAVGSYATGIYNWDGTGKHLLSILMNELHRYEDSFSTFLTKQTNPNTKYRWAAFHLIEKLTFNQFPPALFQPKIDHQNPIWVNGTKILSFNYTKPFNLESGKGPFVFNVHGEVGRGSIIFGIDGTGVDTGVKLYPEIVKFTKTFRLMELSSDPHPQLVQPYVAGTDLQGPLYIKFYGHSLGQADYSYFQAIFDEVDLYESRTHLIFYYKAIPLEDRSGSGNRPAEEMYEKVNHLISRYGETLDNKDHGKNLLHKLLLEGRLSVIMAPL